MPFNSNRGESDKNPNNEYALGKPLTRITMQAPKWDGPDIGFAVRCRGLGLGRWVGVDPPGVNGRLRMS